MIVLNDSDIATISNYTKILDRVYSVGPGTGYSGIVLARTILDLSENSIFSEKESEEIHKDCVRYCEEMGTSSEMLFRGFERLVRVKFDSDVNLIISKHMKNGEKLFNGK